MKSDMESKRIFGPGWGNENNGNHDSLSLEMDDEMDVDVRD